MAAAQTQTQPSAQAEAKESKVNLNELIDATEDLRVVMGKRWGVPPDALLEYVRSYIALWKGAPDGYKVPWAIVYQFMAIAKEHELNPATKEIYGFYNPDKGLQTGVMIDGWITLANRHKAFDGWELEHERNDKGLLVAVSCLLFRKDRTRPTKVRIKIDEWYVDSNPNWKNRREWMGEIKAIKQAIRLGFGFGGLQDENDIELIIQETERRKVEAAPIDAPTTKKSDTLVRKLAKSVPSPEDVPSKKAPKQTPPAEPEQQEEEPEGSYDEHGEPQTEEQPAEQASEQPRDSVCDILGIALDEAGKNRVTAAKAMGIKVTELAEMLDDGSKTPTAEQLDKLEAANVDVRKLREVLGLTPAKASGKRSVE
jgi:hypothetical protein